MSTRTSRPVMDYATNNPIPVYTAPVVVPDIALTNESDVPIQNESDVALEIDVPINT